MAELCGCIFHDQPAIMRPTALHTNTTYDLPITAKTGITIHHFRERLPEEGHDISTPHRDTQYQLFFLEQGALRMQVDLLEHHCSAGDVLLVIPGEVRHVIAQDQPVGWVVFFDPSLMPPALYKDINDFYATRNAVHDAAGHLKPLMNSLLDAFPASGKVQEGGYAEVRYHLLQAILHRVHLLVAQALQANGSQVADKPQLVAAFFTLLRQSFHTWKHTSEYAAVLHVSPGHLNDVVKRNTGHPVSYHIQQAVVTEARRLLFHTGMSVKEISYKLGYEDDNYFSRLFKKIAGQSPLHFRRRNGGAV